MALLGAGVLAKLGHGMAYTAGTAVLATTVAFSGGAINVHVQEHKPNGHNIYVIVPAMLAPAALSFIPQHKREEIARHIGEHWPVIKAAARGLDDLPDGPLVEVQNRREHVIVAKRGGSIVVDVEDGHDTVHVSMPTRTILEVVEKLEFSTKSN
ncbi:MAG: hypothetical protein HY046_11450 [Acidobacteria bacterium]|nr:hypothetical protein [Acidobacteriota bacterium]